MFLSHLSSLLLALPTAFAYIPATASNRTSGFLNTYIADSLISLTWATGLYQDAVSRVASGGIGVEEGALVHFFDNMTVIDGYKYTPVPWIAFVNCDGTDTGGSTENDIFGVAQSWGAVASVLWSNYSTTCDLSPEYLSKGSPPMDIYSVVARISPRIMETRFDVIDAKYRTFDAKQLNASTSAAPWLFAQVHLKDVAVVGGGNSSGAGWPPAGSATTSGTLGRTNAALLASLLLLASTLAIGFSSMWV